MGNLLSYLTTFKKKKEDHVESVPDEDIHEILSRTTQFKQTNKNDPDDMVQSLKEERETDDFKADDTEAAQGDVVPMDKDKPEDITTAESESQQTESKLPRSLLARLFTKNQDTGEKWRRERMVGKVVGSYTVGKRLCKGRTSVIYQTELPGSKTLMSGQFSSTCIVPHEVILAASAQRPSNIICKIADGKYRASLKQEFDILRSVEHPNIVTVFDCISLNNIVAMVMEYIPKPDLHDFIIENWPIAPATRRAFSSQLLSAVEAVHSKGIAHCGIKLESILINPRGDIKLTGFGSVLKVSEATFNSFKSIANTPEYLPPEVICVCADWCSYDIRAIDQWSVGIVLFLLLTGRFPFGEVNDMKRYIKLLKTSPSIELKQNEKHLLFSETGYIDKIRGLLQFNHTNRASIARVLEMPYCQKINMESLLGQRS